MAWAWRAGKQRWLDYGNIEQESAIICICYKWEGAKKVHTLTWDGICDDHRMIAEFLKIAAQADELVAHNGDWFDLKWFHARCLKHGLQPLPEVKTVDTCTIARRRFRLDSNSLDYLAWYLFGEKKIETKFEMWRDLAMTNDPKQMAKMTKYCRRDVTLLERIFHEIARFAPAGSHVGVMAGNAKWSCQYCGSQNIVRNKERVTTKGTISHTMQCSDEKCGKYYTISNAAYWDWYVYAAKQRRLDAEIKAIAKARTKKRKKKKK